MSNILVLVGHVATDPQFKTFDKDGKTRHLCKFRMGVRRPAGKDKSDFFNVDVWGQSAEFLGKVGLVKGDQVIVKGFIEPERKWTDKDGVERVTHSVNVDHAMIGQRKHQDGGGKPSGGGAPPDDDGQYDPFADE